MLALLDRSAEPNWLHSLGARKIGMAIEAISTFAARWPLQAKKVCLTAAIFAGVGLTIGSFFVRSTLSGSSAQRAAKVKPLSPHAVTLSSAHTPSPEELKQIADEQTAPLLERLKVEPKNVALLTQLGSVYHVTHQFREAVACYSKAIEARPGDVGLRTRLAASLYREGDVDGAIAQLGEALRYEPNNANSLFDLGVMRLQGKGDARGALAAWQHLLRSNPRLNPERKAAVVNLMTGVMTMLRSEQETGAAVSRDTRK